MLRTALRNVLAHKARLLMTTLAVLLGVAFVAGTLVFTSTISEALQRSSQDGFDHVDVAVQPDDSSDAAEARPGAADNLGQPLLDAIAALPSVSHASGEAAGFAAIADKEGKLVGEGWSTRGANYYAGSDGTDIRYEMTDGHAPEADGEIALDEKTAERTGYKPGDTVRMSVDGPVREDTVTGIFATDDGNVSAGGTLILFDTATAQALFTAPGEYSQLIVAAANGTSQQELRDEVAGLIPDDAEAVTGTKLAEDEARMIQEQMSGMQTALLAFAGISLFVGIFIIANTFTMLVAQRTKELALLRAVGASRRQVTRSVLIEALAVGVVAGIAGLAAGIGIAAGLRGLTGAMGGTLPDGPLVVSGGTIVASMVVAVLVTMVAAYLPARRASKIPPIAAMSSVHAAATTRGLLVRNSIGALFSAAGAALVLVGINADDDGATMGLGAGLLVIGVFVLTPLLSRPVIAAATPLMKVFGVSGKLARLNAVRNPRRTAATASALMIGLTLVTGLTVIAGSVQKGIDKLASEALDADYVISMANYTPLSPEVRSTLADEPHVTEITGLQISPAHLGGDTDKLHHLVGVNSESISELVNLDFTEGSFDDLAGGQAVIDKELAERHDWTVGDSIAVSYENGESGHLGISGIYQGNQMINGVMLDSSSLTPYMERQLDMQVMLKTTNGVSEASKTELETALGNNPAVLVQNQDDVSKEVASLITMMLYMLYALLGMAIIVAVLGVVNTLAMSVFERRQEIGMLRAIGLDRRATKRMVRLESVVIALFGGVLGICLGVFFGWSVGEVIHGFMSTYELVLPWGTMALFLTLAALVGVLAALWPARRAAKLNMLEAIKAD